PSTINFHFRNQMPPNAAATTSRLSSPNAAAPQSSNAAPARSLLPAQCKSASLFATTEQRSFQWRSPPAARRSAAKKDSQSVASPAASREFSSPAPQYKS